MIPKSTSSSQAGSGTVNITVQSGVVKTDNISSNPDANVTKPIFGYGTSAVTTTGQFTYVGTVTLTWNGTSNGNWTDPRWSGSTSLSYPDDTANAIISTANIVQVTSPQAAYSLQISNGGQVAVAQGAGLSVTTNTNVTAGGTLNVAANGDILDQWNVDSRYRREPRGRQHQRGRLPTQRWLGACESDWRGRTDESHQRNRDALGNEYIHRQYDRLVGHAGDRKRGRIAARNESCYRRQSRCAATVTIAASDANGDPLDAAATPQASGSAAVSAPTISRSLAMPYETSLVPLPYFATSQSGVSLNVSAASGQPALTNFRFGAILIDADNHRRFEWLAAHAQPPPVAPSAESMPDRLLVRTFQATRVDQEPTPPGERR